MDLIVIIVKCNTCKIERFYPNDFIDMISLPYEKYGVEHSW